MVLWVSVVVFVVVIAILFLAIVDIVFVVILMASVERWLTINSNGSGVDDKRGGQSPAPTPKFFSPDIESR